MNAKLEDIYEKELKRSDVVIDHITATDVTVLAGTPRSAFVPYPTQGPSPYTTQRPVPYGNEEGVVTGMPGEFWQPYIFDTGVGNRRGE